MATFAIFFSLPLLLPFSLAMPWLEPTATPTGVMASVGMSLLPTEAPGLNGIPKELLRRQASQVPYPPPNNWCGFVDGDPSSVLSCFPTKTCVYSGSVFGCCDAGPISTCTNLFTACVGYSHPCDNACMANDEILKCSDIQDPYCDTYTFPSGTSLYDCASTIAIGFMSVEFLADYYSSLGEPLGATAALTITVDTVVGAAATSASGTAAATSASSTAAATSASSTAATTSASGASINNVPIQSASQTSQSYAPSYSDSSTTTTHAISVGAVAGIAVVAVILILAIVVALIAWCCIRRRRRRREAAMQRPAHLSPAAPAQPQMSQQHLQQLQPDYGASQQDPYAIPPKAPDAAAAEVAPGGYGTNKPAHDPSQPHSPSTGPPQYTASSAAAVVPSPNPNTHEMSGQPIVPSSHYQHSHPAVSEIDTSTPRHVHPYPHANTNDSQDAIFGFGNGYAGAPVGAERSLSPLPGGGAGLRMEGEREGQGVGGFGSELGSWEPGTSEADADARSPSGQNFDDGF
ncbi:Concanavalin A-like lectin/glucanase, subgroup [Lasallia pustulata]|uniref:Concanavalin A-like lectin/glucanase, subgroup n=1 Tax=Lasallia pustulata TaxID=136370 RepID=A0A1W5D7G1_9LECA|nr:Concanavalin A-like lectin/glucanase, subgroup [Lasallia pustulata]